MVTVSRTKRSASPKGRILGTRVAARFPAKGPVAAIVFGEAPGPNGADKSGIPFFGDRAGLPLYEVLEEEGRCSYTKSREGVKWDGAALVDAGLEPILKNVALSNAYPQCPTDDGHKFRAPKKTEMSSPENVERVRAEIARARKRGLESVVVLGKVADWLLGTHLGLRDDPDIAYYQITHPSPLGLMAMARKAGKGVRVSAMKEEWKRSFTRMLKGKA
jgi:uracil-DNA glycosylase